MNRFLKQSTAVTFRIGPFVDSTDGVTPETGLSIGQADIQISKNGGAFAQTSASPPTTTHDADGWYQCPFTSTDTNTLGPLTVQIVMGGALPVWEHFTVVAANVYDSLVAGSDKLQIDLVEYRGATPANLVDTDKLPASTQHMADGVLAATKIADGAITSTKAPNLDVAVSTRATQLSVDDVPTNSEFNARSLAAADYATASNQATLLDRLSATRAGYLDKLNITGLVASAADIAAITQAQRVRLVCPPMMERPDELSITYRLWIYAYDSQHQAEDLDSNPTVAAEDNLSNDLSANLSAVEKQAGTTGIYYVDYTVADDHEIVGIVFKADCTEQGHTTQYATAAIIVDSTAVDFTSDDRSKLVSLFNKLPSKSFLAGTNNSDGDVQANEMTGDFAGSVASVADVSNITGGLTVAQAEVQIRGEANETLTTVHERVDDAVGAAWEIKSQTDKLTFNGSDVKATLDGETVVAGTVSDKSGYTLTSGERSAIADAVLDEPITEPTGIFAWASASLRTVVGLLGALSRNKIRSTGNATALRNDADDANILFYAQSDDGTTFTSGEAT